MNFINKYLRSLKPYKTASHKIWAVNPDERKNILKLDWNEAVVSPSPSVKEKLKALLNSPNFFNLYPQTFNPELMRALSEYIGLPSENVQYFASSDSLHEYIAKLYISPGDPVLILWPSYDNFRLTAEANGAKLFFSELSENFKFEPEKFTHDIETFKPSLIYICNPNNPTGTFIEYYELEKIIAANPECMFIIDEAYIEFAGEGVNQLVLKYDNLLVTHTLSKAFALANFRFGYLVSCAQNISDINSIRNSKNITTFTQAAAIAALDDADYMRAYAEEVKRARKFFIDSVNKKFSRELYAYDSKGNFVLVRCKVSGLKEKVIAGFESENIFVRNVSQSKSLHDCFRITIGTREQMQRVLDVLREIMN